VPVVADASALVELLVQGPVASAVQTALARQNVLAPDLMDAEVLGALAGMERRSEISTALATHAVQMLRQAPIRRVPNSALMQDAWSLRGNISVYDGLYVALARRVMCPLVTRDARLARSPGLGVSVVVVSQ
jgi:predicted nucleic acid-binding protein